MPTKEFLLEIGTEEIPAWMIGDALHSLKMELAKAFSRCDESFVNALDRAETVATPRRLVLFVPELPTEEPEKSEFIVGPPKNAPRQGVEGFARKMGVPPKKLLVRPTPKGDYWVFTKKKKGQKTANILALELPHVISAIRFPKTMYWTSKGGPRFIRPIRWLVALYGGRVVRFEIAGVASGPYTFGHRAIGKGRLKVTGFEQYARVLRENGVLLEPSERRAKILAEASTLLGREGDGLQLRNNPELLNTLVFLTEFPTAALGKFDPSYLQLPEEVLETVMQQHQKYLSVSDVKGRLASRFIFVMNLFVINKDGAAAGSAVEQVGHGHERVLRARFNDARFFWETDQKIPLRDRLPLLEHVTFQSQLGNYRQKTERNVALVKRLANSVPQAPLEAAVRAAELAKCDLTTELVKEFTKLQGVVGGLYARAQGEPADVATAISGQYKPESMDDSSPPTAAGALVAVADKLDTLAGCFAIGLRPSGSSDPFALRRAVQGVVKILADSQYRINFEQLFLSALNQYQSWDTSGAYAALYTFFKDRLSYFLREVRGFAYDEVNAVMESAGAPGDLDVVDAISRCEAIAHVRPTENFEPLSAAFKRIRNILTKAGGTDQFGGEPDASLLEAGAEVELYTEARRIVEQTKDSTDYETVLRRIAGLRSQVDAYFDQVLVMANDERVRQNRLRMLAWLLRAFTRVADFSEIVVSKEQTSTA